MFKVILLVCAANIAPGDCRADTALYLLNGPDASNEVMCGRTPGSGRRWPTANI
jgi:hypothetical protein